MSLHVLQLGPYPPPEGGITRNILAIRDELRLRGHRCSIIATSRSGTIHNDPDVYRPSSAAGLIQQIRKLDFDVLHLHVGGELTKRVLALGAASAALAPKRSVLTVHSGAFPFTAGARRASPRSASGVIFGGFTHVIAVNEQLAAVFRRYGVHDDRLSIVPPFALSLPDPNVSLPEEVEAFCLRSSPLLVAVGGLEPDYEPLFQVGAMGRICAELPDAGLIVVGDGELRARVAEAIADSERPNSVFLAGNLPHEVTLHLIDRADALLRTTLFDGDAISIREALFLGTPVIATDNGMRPSGVQLIEQGDERALVDCVKQLCNGNGMKPVPQPEDNSNIASVVDLYERLAASV